MKMLATNKRIRTNNRRKGSNIIRVGCVCILCRMDYISACSKIPILSLSIAVSFSYSVRCFTVWHRFHRILCLLANDAQIRAVLTRLRLSVWPSLFTSKSIRISFVPSSKTCEQLYFNLCFSLIFWCYCRLPPMPPLPPLLPPTPFNGSLPFSLGQPHTTLYYAAFRAFQTYYSIRNSKSSRKQQQKSWKKLSQLTYIRT